MTSHADPDRARFQVLLVARGPCDWGPLRQEIARRAAQWCGPAATRARFLTFHTRLEQVDPRYPVAAIFRGTDRPNPAADADGEGAAQRGILVVPTLSGTSDPARCLPPRLVGVLAFDEARDPLWVEKAAELVLAELGLSRAVRPRIFVSYARTDGSRAATALTNAIRRELPADVFLDEEDLAGGDELAQRLYA